MRGQAEALVDAQVKFITRVRVPDLAGSLVVSMPHDPGRSGKIMGELLQCLPDDAMLCRVGTAYVITFSEESQ